MTWHTRCMRASVPLDGAYPCCSTCATSCNASRGDHCVCVMFHGLKQWIRCSSGAFLLSCLVCTRAMPALFTPYSWDVQFPYMDDRIETGLAAAGKGGMWYSFLVLISLAASLPSCMRDTVQGLKREHERVCAKTCMTLGLHNIIVA